MIAVEYSKLPGFRFDLSNIEPWKEEPFGENIRYMMRVSGPNKNSCATGCPVSDFIYPDSGFVSDKTGYGIHGIIDGFSGIQRELLMISLEAFESFDSELTWQVIAFDYNNCVSDHEYPDRNDIVRTPQGWVCYSGCGEMAFVIIGVKNGIIKSEYVKNTVFNIAGNLSAEDRGRIRAEIRNERILRIFGR